MRYCLGRQTIAFLDVGPITI